MRKRLRLYLAHGLPTRHVVREIELQLEERYNIELYNPFYDSSARDEIIALDKNKTISEIHNTFDDLYCETIVRRDLKAIRRCHGIVAYIVGDVGLGTAMEIGYTHHFGYLLVIVSEKYFNHPWARYYADYLFKNREEFEKFLEQYSSHPFRLKMIKFSKNAKHVLKLICIVLHDAFNSLLRGFIEFQRIRKKKSDDEIYEAKKRFIGRM